MLFRYFVKCISYSVCVGKFYIKYFSQLLSISILFQLCDRKSYRSSPLYFTFYRFVHCFMFFFCTAPNKVNALLTFATAIVVAL